MELIQATKRINQLLNTTFIVNSKEYNLSNLGWHFFGFSRAVKTLGLCKCSHNQIVLSKKMTQLRSVEEVEQTMLHELAHAIDKEIRGYSSHDYRWLSIARQIGYKGQRETKISKDNKMEIYNYIAICENHGFVGGFIRRPKRKYYCSKCKTPIKLITKEEYLKQTA